MSLETDILKGKIKEAFKKAKETPPPDDPDDADKIQEDILNTLAADLAIAIEAFVKSGEVINVQVKVDLTVKDVNEINDIGVAKGSAGQVAGQPGNIV